jgi:integrase
MAKAVKRLTKRTVDALKPGELAWDAGVAGFGVRCQRRAKVFILKTRVRGRARWFTIGAYGSPWTVETARRKVRRILGDIADGADPAAVRDSTKGAPVVADLAARYLAEHVDVHNRPRTARTVRQIVEGHLIPALGRQRVADITRTDVVEFHHDMRQTPRHANHVISVLSKMMHLAEAWGWRSDGSNPCRLVKRYTERKRERFLTELELRRLGVAVVDLLKETKLLPGAAIAIRLAALTGCRMSEILTLQWTDVALEAGTLKIREAKAGGRVHPIGASATALLTQLDRSGPWVVWGSDPKHQMSQSTLEHAWQRVRERANLNDIRFHDLRHTVGTYAGQAGANAFLVRDTLGHKTLAMTGRYVSRDEHPLRQLADRVSGRIAAALDGSRDASVVSLKGSRRKSL